MEAIQNRYEFVILFDVENGNPNGDPDAGNMPRTDPETSHGIVTDVCLKRKIRNYVDIVKEGKPYFNILIKPDKALNTHFTEAYEAEGLPTGLKGKNSLDVKIACHYMCENYYDVRTFGMVMNTGEDFCGIVRGPVQLGFAKSIDPVLPQDLTITRQAKTTIDRQAASGTSEMGKKSIVPYGLYRAEGYVSALLAQRLVKFSDKEKENAKVRDTARFSEEDLALLWTAIENMFEHDRSAARGKMCLRKLFVFKHDSALGNSPAQVLFEKIAVEKKADVDVPRSFADYTVAVNREMPSGVTLIERV